ncbi:hypothetical protein A9R05_42360 (plasmid) [Burkholderia sp. KK1]|uniref:hypothetical protein n=1 Tax=Burkholderia sp. M701 TaxID=326454 RepID=UPI000979A8DB|nr:hypothetical protein [Burkholderia sp. M701]AQH05664.1 hypothetical protein A9R05_42360 [Burkholderia sp. KK1]
MSDTPAAFQLANYSGSRDYDRLADLSRKASILCIVDDELGRRDAARTHYMNNHGQDQWTVSARGMGYITAFGLAEFKAFCAHRNLEFIEPVGMPPSTLAEGEQ